MRLSEQSIKTFKEKFTKIFGKRSINLFGSRVDDRKKVGGGDIDLYLKAEDKISFISEVRIG